MVRLAGAVRRGAVVAVAADWNGALERPGQ